MPRARPPPTPKPKVTVKYQWYGEEIEVDVILPYYAVHLAKGEGAEPHADWDESMWELDRDCLLYTSPSPRDS